MRSFLWLLFLSDFWQFDYDEPSCQLLKISLHFRLTELLEFVNLCPSPKFWIFSHFSSKTFFFLHVCSSPFGNMATQILDWWYYPLGPWSSIYFSTFFLSLVQTGLFPLFYLQVHWFFSHLHFAIEFSQGIFLLYFSILHVPLGSS